LLEHFTIEGDLTLLGVPIRQLPENMHVGGTLDLGDILIELLPDTLVVGGSLLLRQLHSHFAGRAFGSRANRFA
jgi:hypothetical protein